MSEDKSEALGTCDKDTCEYILHSCNHAKLPSCANWKPLPSSEGTTLDPQINPCACVCHKAGLFGLMCCPCSMKALDELVNGKATKPQPPSVPLKSETTSQFCFECDDENACASAEVCYAMHEGYPKKAALKSETVEARKFAESCPTWRVQNDGTYWQGPTREIYALMTAFASSLLQEKEQRIKS